MVLFPLQESYTLIVLAFVIIILLPLSFIYKTSKITTNAPEASGAWPIIGHYKVFSGSFGLPHRAFASMAERYGPIFTVRLGIHRVLVVSNWEIAKELFTTHDVVVSYRPKYLAAKILGHNFASFTFAPYGSYWRGIRKIISLELLSSTRLDKLKYVRLFELENSIKNIVELWREKRDGDGKVSVEMKNWFWELNLNTILQMVAGKRYTGVVDGEDEEELKSRREVMREWFYYLGKFVVADALPILRWLDLGGHEKTMTRVARELDSMIGKWLEEHRKETSSNDATKFKDFIDVMIHTIAAEGLEDYDVDTVIKATCTAEDEIETHVGKDRQVNESDIKNLVYLQAIVKETLRLYPAGFLGGPRLFSEDCIVAGYHVPKGTWLLINMWKLHRDPNIWSDPLEFRPERFLTLDHKDVDVKGMDFELIPFGAGRRSCPGMGLAVQMLHMVLATLLQNFEMSTPNGAQVDMTESAGVTNAKATPLEILFTPRFHGITDG